MLRLWVSTCAICDRPKDERAPIVPPVVTPQTTVRDVIDVSSAGWASSDISNGMQHRQCEQCSGWFMIFPNVGRPEKRFCSDACRMRAYRKRKSLKDQDNEDGYIQQLRHLAPELCAACFDQFWRWWGRQVVRKVEDITGEFPVGKPEEVTEKWFKRRSRLMGQMRTPKRMDVDEWLTWVLTARPAWFQRAVPSQRSANA